MLGLGHCSRVCNHQSLELGKSFLLNFCASGQFGPCFATVERTMVAASSCLSPQGTCALVFALHLYLTILNPVHAQSIKIVNPPLSVVAGQSTKVQISYTAPGAGLVQVQLFDSSWKFIARETKPVQTTSGDEVLTITIPASTTGSGFIWQALVYTSKWRKLAESTVAGVTASPPGTTPTSTSTGSTTSGGKCQSGSVNSLGQWVPPGKWDLVWRDEFNGADLSKWNPLLAYDIETLKKSTELAYRWETNDPETARMYIPKSGNHRLQNGKLVLDVSVSDERNKVGKKVYCGYLLTGKPVGFTCKPGTFKADESCKDDKNITSKWDGATFSPQRVNGKNTNSDAIYLSADVNTGQFQGLSSWFAFWLMDQQITYVGERNKGWNEIDIIEIPKSKTPTNYFNIANHQGANETYSLEFTSGRATRNADNFVDVNQNKYQSYGLLWEGGSTPRLTYYVNGQVLATTTKNVPLTPDRMFLYLTTEFQLNLWREDQGDGRVSSKTIDTVAGRKVISRALVDFVRVYARTSSSC